MAVSYPTPAIGQPNPEQARYAGKVPALPAARHHAPGPVLGSRVKKQYHCALAPGCHDPSAEEGLGFERPRLRARDV